VGILALQRGEDVNGGTVRIPSVTDHVASAVAVARAFDRPIEVDDAGAPQDGVVLVGPS